MSAILQKELLSAARERQLTEILETSPLDWHFAGLLSHPLQNIRNLRPPVSVVVSMREIDRIQQQPSRHIVRLLSDGTLPARI